MNGWPQFCANDCLTSRTFSPRGRDFQTKSIKRKIAEDFQQQKKDGQTTSSTTRQELFTEWKEAETEPRLDQQQQNKYSNGPNHSSHHKFMFQCTLIEFICQALTPIHFGPLFLPMTSSATVLFIASLSLTLSALCRAQFDAAPKDQAPPFLAEAGQDKINEFYQLTSSLGQFKDAEITEKVKEWVGKQSDDIQKKYAAFEEEREKAKAESEAAHQQAVKNFSKDAKKADKELTEIANNPNLTAQEKAKQINDKVQSLPKEVRDEIGGGAMDGGQPQHQRKK